MQTVVLAAGMGTRMGPLTATQPKGMLPVAGRPLIEHTIDAAVTAGASRLVLVVGYKKEVIQSYFGEEYRGIPISYAVQESVDGTASAVQAARPALTDAPFAVLNGDNLYDGSDLIELFGTTPSVGTISVENPEHYGVLKFDGKYVREVIEKPDDPPSNRINTGAYVFPAEAQEWLETDESIRGEFELTDVLNETCGRMDVYAIDLHEWMDVGRPWELLEANERLLSILDHDIKGTVSEDATLSGPVVVEENAWIRDGVTLDGPVLVEAGATVGPNAFIRGATVIGENSSIGHAVEIKNTVVMAGTAINHLSYVGDSVIGRNVNFGAGTIVANLRHDDAPIRVMVKGEPVSTNRRKFGVVVGDGTKTGIHTSLNPGITLNTNTMTNPGETVTRDR